VRGDDVLIHVKTKFNDRIRSDPKYKHPHAGINANAARYVTGDGEIAV
jgi:hypothetical protein